MGIVLVSAVMVLRVAAMHKVAAAVGIIRDHAAVVIVDSHRPVATTTRGRCRSVMPPTHVHRPPGVDLISKGLQATIGAKFCLEAKVPQGSQLRLRNCGITMGRTQCTVIILVLDYA